MPDNRDAEALRKALNRANREWRYWRERYLELQARVNRLYDLKETIREVEDGHA